MSRTDIVADIEMYAINIGVTYTFGINHHPDGIEVLLYRHGKPRRLALCTHLNDAEAIIEGLNLLQKTGKV